MVAAAAVMTWRPAWWPLPLSAALCFAAFGLWGLADREAATPRSTGSRILCGVAIAVGTAAAVTLVIGVVALGLGTIIS